jgi:hypothetical protein
LSARLPLGAWFGWGLAAAALLAGYAGYGWPGVGLAFTVIVFWLLLQFSRALRALRVASSRPVGQVDNAVMLHARLRTGLQMAQLLGLTRSLGRPLHPVVDASPAPAPVQECFVWEDASGDRVEVELLHGRVQSWRLERAQPAQEAAGAAGAGSAGS